MHSLPSVDPVVKHHESPYAAFGNNPIGFVDVDGRDTTIAGKITAQSEIMKNPGDPGFVPAGVKLESTANVSANIVDGKFTKVKALVYPKEFESPAMPSWMVPGEGIDPAFTEVRNLRTSISKDCKTAKIHYDVQTQLTNFEALGQWTFGALSGVYQDNI